MPAAARKRHAAPSADPQAEALRTLARAIDEGKASRSVRVRIGRLLRELEDLVDALELEAALSDPRNRKRIPWEQARRDLGL